MEDSPSADGLVVTPASFDFAQDPEPAEGEAGVHDVLPFPAQGRSHPAYAGLT